MTPENVETIYRLSAMQRGLLFHTIVDPQSRFYVDQVVYTLDGDLDEGAFEAAWRAALERHAILRTSFHWKGLDELVQVVHHEAPLSIERYDWRDTPSAPQERIERFLSDDRARGFEIERPPLVRLSLVRTGEGRRMFVFRYHHMLLDAWSALMVLEEVFERYGDLIGGRATELPSAPSYQDYVGWLRRQDLDGAQAYWRTALAEFRTPSSLPHVQREHLSPVDGERHRESAEQRLELDAATTSRLGEVAREARVTLSTVIQVAWAVCLARYSDATDVVFGMTGSNRPPELAGIERTAGLFITTLPVRVQLADDEAFAACCRRVQRDQAAARAWAFSGLDQIQEWSDLPPGTPLFDSIMTFLNVPGIATMGGHDGALTVRDGQYRYKTNYPLSIMVIPGERLGFRVGYDRERVDDATVERIIGQLRRVLEAVAADPGAPTAALPVLPEAERARLERFAVADRSIGASAPAATFHGMVAERAARAPAKVATVLDGETLTYGELDRAANGLAHRLVACGVGKGDIVGLYLERSHELVAGALGVLKAGGAFLPLDPSHPDERVAFMLTDADAKIVLTHEALTDRVPASGARPMSIDAKAEHADSPPEITVGADDLAYVIYTSGSTGRPKGTLLAHRGLTNVAAAQGERFGVGPGDRVLQWASASFDASVFDLAMALPAGAELHLASREQVMPGPGLQTLLARRGITCLTITPSALAALVPAGLECLRLLVVAGEAFPEELAMRWRGPGRRVFNAYGPTESTIWATAAECDDGGGPPIGWPIRDVRAVVRDRLGRLTPIGVTGELHLGGSGVARGYLGRPALTAERFVPSPEGPAGAREYRTGDLVRRREDGALEYIARADSQVKLRGVRVEIAEIETLLQRRDDVAAAAVLVADAGTEAARLLAFVRAAHGAMPTGQELRDELALRVPEQMLPARVIVVDELPLTTSGKLDANALLELAVLRPDDAEDEAALSPAESVLAEIWGEVLGVDEVGRHDDFFDLGGNSMRATRIASRLRQRFDVEISLRSIFEGRTVAACTALVENELLARLAEVEAVGA